uniref:Uncharacterized protein n=1 Tax=uncultured Thiotrichaceae bacterium TaxID=298394 RepID=A0A6S6UI62_9GAMM|nr:MAG: Unknown protein [uncultured Thiotrichaceae bacterium]
MKRLFRCIEFKEKNLGGLAPSKLGSISGELLMFLPYTL